jgi:hypothetical protein
VLGPLVLAMALSGCAMPSAEPTPAGLRQLLAEWHSGSPTRMSEAEAEMVIARAITAHEMRWAQGAAISTTSPNSLSGRGLGTSGLSFQFTIRRSPSRVSTIAVQLSTQSPQLR